MKKKARTPRKRDLKAIAKIKEAEEVEVSQNSQTGSAHVRPNIEDLIICQICKEQVERDHKMCPKCSCIWCTECITQCFNTKKTIKCPNCRAGIYKKSLKKLPLFEKLKELIQDVTIPAPVPKISGCPNHNLPDEYYCKECDILCCSNCALLSDNHKNHSFVSLEEIYKVKKESILQFQDSLGTLSKECQNLLDTSLLNIKESKKNLDSFKAQFNKCAKGWIEDFEGKFNSQLEGEAKSKRSIEELLSEARSQNVAFQGLLENPQKTELIRSYNETVHNARGTLVKQDNLDISKVVEGEEIDNQFFPQFTVQECAIPPISDDTPVGQYLYSQEFVVIKDKFKLGAKVNQGTNSKTVDISLRIYKPNSREKEYKVLLYHPQTSNLIDEFELSVDKEKQAENHILMTSTMNYNFDKLKSEDGRIIFLLKVRPASYLQVTLDQQDYIEQLERANAESSL